MKLYAICSPSHAVLRDQWFLPSAEKVFEEIIVETVPQDCVDGVYMHSGWKKTMERKIDLLLRAVEENWGGIFVYSDVDIQFFNSVETLSFESLLGEQDVVFQNSQAGGICMGFLVCRANEAMQNFWRAAKEEIRENCGIYGYSDQSVVNFLLGIKKYRGSWRTFIRMNIPWAEKVKHFYYRCCQQQKKRSISLRWGCLPEQFYSPGKFWHPGEQLDIPQDIVLHHANWTIGIQNKIAQLEYVRRIVSERHSNVS
ncbi:MAG: putative nucleotide-diphospho-sugar transferase [Candidatus Peribacteraceae bacterium]|nr:putative nucleotide-diphospho-sugar transferase [Candidatus Peribacteraceae bacterium]